MDFKTYTIIGKVTAAISKETVADQAIRSALKILIGELNIDYAVLWHKTESDQKIHPYYWIAPFDLTSQSFDLNEGLIGKAYASESAIIKLDCSEEDGFGPFNNVKSIVCTPFSCSDIGSGCISFINTKEPMSEDDADVCQILTL